MKKQPKVTILTATYNSDLKLLKECLNSLKKETDYKNYKVVVSDNGSTNGVQDLIRKEFKWVHLIENNKNLGFGGGNNIAIKYSLKKYNPDYVFLLNDDMKITRKDWLKELVKTAESDPKIGVVGINPVYEDGTPQNPGGYIKGPLITIDKEIKGMQEVDHTTGICLIKRKVINKIGLIDEVFFPYLLEETDYCLRAKKAGFKIISRGDIKLLHYKGQTIEKVDKELKRNFIRLKNDLIFSLINMKLHYAFIRIFFYLPLVMFLKKKDEKKDVSIKNAKFRGNLLKNLGVLIKGYWFMLSHLKLIYRKRLERKRNSKIWY